MKDEDILIKFNCGICGEEYKVSFSALPNARDYNNTCPDCQKEFCDRSTH